MNENHKFNVNLDYLKQFKKKLREWRLKTNDKLD